MKKRFCCFVFALSLPAITMRAIERLPIEDFAREPATSQAHLAPDGKHYAFLRDHLGLTKLHIADIENKELVRVTMRRSELIEGAQKEVASFAWVNERRLLVTTTVWDLLYGVMAVDRDGQRSVPIRAFSS